MRYTPVTTCIECGERPPLPKRRYCKECWRLKNREANRKCREKRRAEKKRRNDWVARIMEKKPVTLPPQEPKEFLKGYLNYVYPKNYAGIRNL